MRVELNLTLACNSKCPNCNRLITFSVDSADAGVQRAMTDVRRIKNGMLLSINRVEQA